MGEGTGYLFQLERKLMDHVKNSDINLRVAPLTIFVNEKDKNGLICVHGRATLWWETSEEIKFMLKPAFTMDNWICDNNTHQHYFQWDLHVFFDDVTYENKDGNRKEIWQAVQMDKRCKKTKS